MANQEGYDLVLDRVAGAVVFWKKDNDLTQRVIDILNKESPSTTPAASTTK